MLSELGLKITAVPSIPSVSSISSAPSISPNGDWMVSNVTVANAFGGQFAGAEVEKVSAPCDKTVVPTVAKVETYNNKVVKVTFADGKVQKAVCSDVDQFSIDVGITICVLKKMLGEDGHKRYNKLMRDVHKLMMRQAVEKAEKRLEAEANARKAKRAKEKAEARKQKAREDYIEAHVEALRRYGAESNGGRHDA